MERDNFEPVELQHINVTRSHEEASNGLHQKPSISCSPICPFSKEDFSSLDAAQRSKTTLKLGGLIIIYTIVTVIEIIGGLRANSLVIITDAAHLLSDIAGFSVSLFAVRVSGWDPTRNQSFGFNRLEVLGALLSVQLIWLIFGTLIYQAIQRLIAEETEINGKLMFLVSAFSFLVNFLLVLWLGHDHSHHEPCEGHGEETQNLVSSPHGRGQILNINIQGAYLHIMTDLIQSVGVMIAGSIIWWNPDWLVVDLVCTTLPMLKNVFSILMERAPGEIDINSLEIGLKLVPGVRGVHDLHVWAITVGKNVMACHVVVGTEV